MIYHDIPYLSVSWEWNPSCLIPKKNPWREVQNWIPFNHNKGLIYEISHLFHCPERGAPLISHLHTRTPEEDWILQKTRSKSMWAKFTLLNNMGVSSSSWATPSSLYGLVQGKSIYKRMMTGGTSMTSWKSTWKRGNSNRWNFTGSMATRWFLVGLHHGNQTGGIFWDFINQNSGMTWTPREISGWLTKQARNRNRPSWDVHDWSWLIQPQVGIKLDSATKERNCPGPNKESISR